VVLRGFGAAQAGVTDKGSWNKWEGPAAGGRVPVYAAKARRLARRLALSAAAKPPPARLEAPPICSGAFIVRAKRADHAFAFKRSGFAGARLGGRQAAGGCAASPWERASGARSAVGSRSEASAAANGAKAAGIEAEGRDRLRARGGARKPGPKGPPALSSTP
jgi:hypothetical protein